MGCKVWIGKWKGGRMFAGQGGRPVYVLRKMINVRNYTIHLDARSEAEVELALFVRDPPGPTPARARREGPDGPVEGSSVQVGLLGPVKVPSPGWPARPVAPPCVRLFCWAREAPPV